jgi:cobalt-zinc-cadmium efflux system outer membrane protein
MQQIRSRRVIALFVTMLAGAPAGAQTLRDALEQAWSRQPLAQTRAEREADVAARRSAATALLPEPPAVTLGHRTDRYNRNIGKREWEGELDIPLWLPGERSRRAGVADAEQAALDTRLAAVKWKLAGEVRDAYWDTRLAEIELALAQRRVEAAALLAGDVERRVKAGDLARVDLNQARAAEHAARASLEEARARAFRTQQAFAVLTGLERIADAAEAEAPAPALEAHPRLAGLQRAVALAQARLIQVTQNRRGFPELAVGVTREHGEFAEPYATTLSMRIRIPFATESRNQPRIASANLGFAEAQAEYGLERRRLEAEAERARRELDRARAVERLAAERFRLAEDTQRLHAKAFALGELDLPARLRAENERFDAELLHSRSRVEADRAVSRLNQAQGILP